MAKQDEAVTVGIRCGRMIQNERLAVHVLRQLVELIEVGVGRPGRLWRGGLGVAQPVEHFLTRHDCRGRAEVADRAAKPALASRTLERCGGCQLLVAAGVLRGRAGVEDEAHALRRPRRRDERIEVRTRPRRAAEWTWAIR